MNLSDFSIKNPYVVISVSLLIIVLGLFAFTRTPVDLFPNTVPPQVVVVTVWPGADSSDIADKITQIIEKEVSSISGIRRITSTSRDEVSSINIEFKYYKPLGEAVLDVQNSVSKIRAELPREILEPRIYKISDATRPLLTISLSPKDGKTKTLSQIRLLAKNQIENSLLNVDGISDVDVFGGHKPEIRVKIDKLKLTAHSLSLNDVVAALSRNNVSAPAGTIYSKLNEYLMKVSGEYKNLEDIRNVPLFYKENGILKLRDIAEVTLSESEKRSFYHGNGKPAIAVNVMKPIGGATVKAIKNVKKEIKKLEKEYPDIEFNITDDQQPIIDLNVNGMKASLVQAIIFTVLVIFLFLADMRAAVVVSVSIPMAFLASLVVLWFSPFTMNMVTLSGLIISVGMVVDASIVVLENIYRHHKENKGEDPRKSASDGASEVALATTAGMLTTIIVLIPVMFAGGYTEQVMRPLNLMIGSTLIASLFAALTIVPLIASRLLSKGDSKKNVIENFFSFTDKLVKKTGDFFIFILNFGLNWRIAILMPAMLFLVFTMKNIKPIIGNELMPAMDTGIVNIEFTTPSDTSPDSVERTLNKVEKILYKQKGVVALSSVVGSEPGEISFGGGGSTAQKARVKVTLVNRTKRKETIWQIEDKWRKELAKVREINSFRVLEYGATPLSTTKAPLDIIISGPKIKVLDKLAEVVLKKLNGIQGLVDVKREWFLDKKNCIVKIDPELASLYQVSQPQVAKELKTAVKGITATFMRLKGYLDIPIIVKYRDKDMDDPVKLKNTYIKTKMGQIPLRAMATIKSKRAVPFITRENLTPTIDITGVSRGYTIGQVTAMVRDKLKDLILPEGYKVTLSGTDINMKLGQKEMGHALIIGVAMLFILLVAMFNSFLHPFTIMAAIPLAVAGGFWGLLFFDKPMCKPAMMGMILLGGTIVNNSILLIDFIITARKKGLERKEAILQSVRLRLRPILMTTVSTIVGLTPLILERAVGLERMSPLGIVAASGLLVGTFLTMILIPVVYSIFDDISVKFNKLIKSI